MSDGSFLLSMFTFTAIKGDQAINVFTNTQTFTGVYSLRVSVTDPKTGILDSN